MTRVGLIRIAVVAAAIGALELACRLGFIKHQVIIPPSEMATALYGLLVSGVLNADIQRTLGIIAVVIVVSIILGFVLGLAIHALPQCPFSSSILCSSRFSACRPFPSC
jgi:NitT/TauT family transport system permease protein